MSTTGAQHRTCTVPPISRPHAVYTVTEPGVVWDWLGYAEGANVHRINRIGLENGLTKFTSFTR